MGLLFADKPVYSAAELFRECQRVGFPTDWYAKANRYENPLGFDSGTGAVLLTRKQIDSINLDARHDLTFRHGPKPDEKVTLKNLHVAGACACVSPGKPKDKAAVYLVPLADDRRLLRLALSKKAYNLRLTPTGGYATYTMKRVESSGGSTDEFEPWPWADMWDDIWQTFPARYAGETPALPFDPDGIPEGFDGYDKPVWELARHVLMRLSCDLAVDLTAEKAGRFQVVRLGDGQRGIVRLEDRWLERRLFDREPVSPSLGTVPASVAVYFRKQPTRGYGNNQYWVVEVGADGEVNGTSTAKGEEGTVRVYDDMIATYQGGSLTNEDDLNDRATTRAEEFFNERRLWLNQPAARLYAGALKDFKTGELTQSVMYAQATWDEESEDGVTTTVTRWPTVDPVESWPGNPEEPWRLSEVLYVTQDEVGPGWVAYVERWNAADQGWERLFDAEFIAMNEENPPEEGRYVCVFSGYDADNFLPVYAGGCCPDAGAPPAGGGGGGPGDTPPPTPDGVSVPCCDVPVSTTLFATFGGALADVGTVTMVWDVAGHRWSGFGGPCGVLGISFNCPTGPTDFNLVIGPAASDVSNPPTRCGRPFTWGGSGTAAALFGCPGGAFTVDVTD